MNTRHSQPDLLTQYLLGDLSEPEREPFEENYFTDDELFAELLETENKLITDYLHGRLAQREKALFEQNYLATPCGRQKLELAQLLDRSETAKSILNDNREREDSPSPRPSRFQSLRTAAGTFKPAIWIPAMASLLIAAAVGTVMLRSSGPEPAANLPSGTASSSPPPGEIIERVALEPADIVRSGTRNVRLGSLQPDSTLRTGTATKYVEIKLLLAPPVYPKYQGQVLNKESNAKVTSKDSLLPEADKAEKFVRWKIESEALPQGDYSVELRGVKPSGETVDPSSYDLKVRAR
jgi:hypothetical protein